MMTLQEAITARHSVRKYIDKEIPADIVAALVFVTHAEAGIAAISTKSWLFLILSGLATGASWLCYFYAIKTGEVSKVVPIDKCSLVLTIILAAVFLGEAMTWKTIIGSLLIVAGTLIMII